MWLVYLRTEIDEQIRSYKIYLVVNDIVLISHIPEDSFFML